MYDLVTVKRAALDAEKRQLLSADIDRQVVRQQLLDVEGQLARMAPVRYELLRLE